MTQTPDPAIKFIDLRWGVAILEASEERQPLYDFMLKNYIALGVTQEEFLLILHLMAYRYNSVRGESRPSLETIAKEMGVSDTRVRQLVKSLEGKAMLTVCRRDGNTSLYEARPFAIACLQRWYQAKGLSPDLADLQGNLTPQINLTPQENLYPPPKNISGEGAKKFIPKNKKEEKETKKEKSIAPIGAAPLLTKGGLAYFTAWQRKRWANEAQRKAFEAVEAEVGSETMVAAVQWAANAGISDVNRIIKAARGWGKPKANGGARAGGRAAPVGGGRTRGTEHYGDDPAKLAALRAGIDPHEWDWLPEDQRPKAEVG